METLKKFFSNVYNVIGTVFIILLGLLGIERMRRKSAQSQLENANTNAESKVIDAKLDANQGSIEAINDKVAEAKEEADKESLGSLTDWFKRRG
jgi:hypothetical protein